MSKTKEKNQTKRNHSRSEREKEKSLGSRMGFYKTQIMLQTPTPTKPATVFDISRRDERQRTINLTDNRQKNIARVGLFLTPFLA